MIQHIYNNFFGNLNSDVFHPLYQHELENVSSTFRVLACFCLSLCQLILMEVLSFSAGDETHGRRAEQYQRSPLLCVSADFTVSQVQLDYNKSLVSPSPFFPQCNAWDCWLGRKMLTLIRHVLIPEIQRPSILPSNTWHGIKLIPWHIFNDFSLSTYILHLLWERQTWDGFFFFFVGGGGGGEGGAELLL